MGLDYGIKLKTISITMLARDCSFNRALLPHRVSNGCYLSSRNEWRQLQARDELEQLGGLLYQGLASQVGTELLEHEVKAWDKMIFAADRGQLRPTHLRHKKPKKSASNVKRGFCINFPKTTAND